SIVEHPIHGPYCPFSVSEWIIRNAQAWAPVVIRIRIDDATKWGTCHKWPDCLGCGARRSCGEYQTIRVSCGVRVRASTDHLSTSRVNSRCAGRIKARRIEVHQRIVTVVRRREVTVPDT